MTRWTIKRLDAVINAITAMLAGEEGEGDWDPAHSADDMQAGLRRMLEERERLQRAGRERLQRAGGAVRRSRLMARRDLAIACPRCDVAVDVRCTSMSNSGYKALAKSHAERVSAWAARCDEGSVMKAHKLDAEIKTR